MNYMYGHVYEYIYITYVGSLKKNEGASACCKGPPAARDPLLFTTGSLATPQSSFSSQYLTDLGQLLFPNVYKSCVE